MSDIKILEERINFCKNNTECQEVLNQCFGCTFEVEEIQAIKNIIAENKELKRKLQEHICIEAHEQVKQLYIPKSKVKEIIYPTPENPISFELQSSVMYKKLERLVEE